MPGLDRLISDPASFLLLALAWASIAVWVFTFTSWGIMGDIEAWLAFLSIMAVIALGVLASNPPHETLRWWVGGALILSLPLFPSLRKISHDRQLAQIEFERIERAYETLLLRPDNPGSIFRIAEGLHSRGYAAIAVPLAARALRQMPVSLFPVEHRMVEAWRVQMIPANEAAEVRCPHCGTANDPQDVFCLQCGEPHLLAFARGSWSGGPGLGRILAGWLSATCLTIGIPTAATSPLPSPGKWVLTAALAAAAGLLLLRALAKVFER